MSIELVGWVAVVLTQVFWIPNLTRIFRTRDVEGYSLIAWGIMFLGLSCWLVYFVSKGDIVGTVANVSGVSGAGITLGCIWYWGKGRARARSVRRRQGGDYARRIEGGADDGVDSVNQPVNL